MSDERIAITGDVDDWDAPPMFTPETPPPTAATDDPEINAAEQEALARDLGEELTDVFVRYVRGEVDFADLTFLTYDLLHDLHIVASGAYELEYDDEEESDGDLADTYEQSAATDQQEELAQEPARS